MCNQEAKNKIKREMLDREWKLVRERIFKIGDPEFIHQIEYAIDDGSIWTWPTITEQYFDVFEN